MGGHAAETEKPITTTHGQKRRAAGDLLSEPAGTVIPEALIRMLLNGFQRSAVVVTCCLRRQFATALNVSLMKIGIIGSGIAGLVAAYQLERQGHQVTVFEKQPATGMAAHEVAVEIEGKLVRGDVPSRMFNQLQWPGLLALYREVGVEIEPVSPTQSFSRWNGETYLTLDVAYRPQSRLRTVLSRRGRRILNDSQRLFANGPVDLSNGIDPTLGFADYLDQHDYSNEFKYEFIYPTLSSTVCTCSYQSLDRYPAVILLSILRNLTAAGTPPDNRPLLWKTKHGTSDVVSRLLANVDDVRLSTQVISVNRDEGGVMVSHRERNVQDAPRTTRFDHVVIATQANAVAGLVADLSASEREMLGCFHYETTFVAVHTDATMMPVQNKHWATFNQLVCEYDGQLRRAMCSVLMNRFHRDWDVSQPIFQTINPLGDINADRLIATATLQRPVINRDSYRGWQLRDELHRQVDRRLWYCGSYASPGVPLLESGVQSVLDLPLLSKLVHCGAEENSTVG